MVRRIMVRSECSRQATQSSFFDSDLSSRLDFPHKRRATGRARVILLQNSVRAAKKFAKCKASLTGAEKTQTGPIKFARFVEYVRICFSTSPGVHAWVAEVTLVLEPPFMGLSQIPSGKTRLRQLWQA